MIQPTGALLTLSGTASGNLYADSIEYEFVLDPFDRLEFSNPKLRSAPTSSGGEPMIVSTFGNKKIQLASTCTGDSPRPLVPDDANIGNIKQQFNIHRFTVQGAPSLGTHVDNIYVISQDHLKKISKFNLHIEKANMELSYSHIHDTMQAETFSYLTTTGLSIAGTAIGGSLSNILITSFSPGVAYLHTSSGDILKDFRMVFEVRTITSRTA